MTNVFNKPSVLIVGAGEFGSTTAVELLRSGNYGSVTILDRATTLPALDAASTDINKVVRYDYADAEYAALACEAVRRWEQPQWKGVYFPTGVLMRGLTDGNAQEIYDNARKLEPRVKLMDNPADVKRRISPSGKAVLGKEAGIKSYWNPGGGWVHASGAINKLYDELKQRGAQIVPGAELASLIVEDGDVKGVRTVDRREFTADKVILALGSWTGGHPALKGIFPPELLVPTGHTIAAVQLTPAEQEQYKDVPTIANLDNSGFYMFPPNQTGQVKFALHAGGFTVPNAVPRTAADPEAVRYTEANRVGWIPKQSFKVMREKLAGLYPELAKKPMAFTRMCWYSDTPDGNFVIDFAPQYKSLLIASGGAGHAFKFLPVMGEVIHARLEGRLAPNLQKKWAITRHIEAVNSDREGRPGRAPLVLSDLTTAEDLGPLGEKARL